MAGRPARIKTPRTRLQHAVWRVARRLNLAKDWLVAQAAYALLWLLRRLPPDRALNFADRAARKVGPWFGRHRTATSNLRAAYPEKTDAEIEAIALDMWGNMARLAAEYVFLDDIFDFDPARPELGRVEIVGADIFDRLVKEDRPHIFFTGHTGSFELLPVAAAKFGLPLTALFRAPNNPYLAEYVFATRTSKMGGLVQSRRGAAFSLAGILDDNGNVGMLVDQKFGGKHGVPTTFFGRPCKSNPLLAKLARHYECDVYPTRTIRLPGNRYRLIVEEKLALPQSPKGGIDVAATTQLLQDVVERWVREHPGQWMWFHKRWK